MKRSTALRIMVYICFFSMGMLLSSADINPNGLLWWGFLLLMSLAVLLKDVEKDANVLEDEE